mmetsp:Transcript_10006/g.28440  ORF Transcript_10006/g.28440 Transcript_10006/m.28440 type:complete len:203 (+) Transcript_10006:568-1176(+)
MSSCRTYATCETKRFMELLEADTERPLTEMTPLSSEKRPLRALSKVVLPLPDGPSNARTWPGAAKAETSLRMTFWVGPVEARRPPPAPAGNGALVSSLMGPAMELRMSPTLFSCTVTAFLSRLQRRTMEESGVAAPLGPPSPPFLVARDTRLFVVPLWPRPAAADEDEDVVEDDDDETCCGVAAAAASASLPPLGTSRLESP